MPGAPYLPRWKAALSAAAHGLVAPQQIEWLRERKRLKKKAAGHGERQQNGRP
jgi:hypothetical protein